MLKRILKSALTATLCLAVILSVSTLATAASAIRVTVGTKSLYVSPVLLQDGTTYAPYDKLFPALGAKAAYDKTARTITAVTGDTKVVIPVDGSTIEITAGGENYIMTRTPCPIVNTSSGRIYIPVRCAAQALGYAVTWDGAARSVVLQSVDQLIAKSGATYSVVDRVLAYDRSFAQKNRAFDGSFSMTMDMQSLLYSTLDDYDGNAPSLDPLTLSGTATGLIDKGGEEMSMNLKTNFSNLAALLADGGELDDETKEQLKLLEDVDLNLIVNNETGTTYMKSPLFSTLAKASDDAWISFETGEADLLSGQTAGLAGLSLADITNEGGSFRDYVSQTLKSELYSGVENVAESLDQINAICSDQVMVRSGDTYTVTVTTSQDQNSMYTGDTTLELAFSFDGDAFAGISLTVSSSAAYSFNDLSTSMKTDLSYKFSADGKGSFVMTETRDDATLLSLKLDFTYTETTKTPAREPAAGSTVIPVDELQTQDTSDSEDQAA